MLLVAGIAAEVIVHGETEGGENNENLFRDICYNSCGAGFSIWIDMNLSMCHIAYYANGPHLLRCLVHRNRHQSRE